MKRALHKICSILLIILLWAGIFAVFYFARRVDRAEIFHCLLGILISFIAGPVIHETGHLLFSKIMDMDCIYIKMFCFQMHKTNGQKKLSFASPFADDMVQVIPKKGGDMKKRASWYTLGGLLVSAIFLLIILSAAILASVFTKDSYFLWGLVPYTAYLFLLNVLPLYYEAGKTDMLVYMGICKGAPTELNLLSAMEIQGRLYAGESFAMIDKALYFDPPQLCEDEPLFSVMLDLKYRYYLELSKTEEAADCLNRLALSQAYLSGAEVATVAAELVYMHAITGDFEKAEENGKYCKDYLQQETATALRILAAYAKASGKEEEAQLLKEKAERALEKEPILGVRAFEKALLSRI